MLRVPTRIDTESYPGKSKKLAIFEQGVTTPLPPSEHGNLNDYLRGNGPSKNKIHFVPGFSSASLEDRRSACHKSAYISAIRAKCRECFLGPGSCRAGDECSRRGSSIPHRE